MAILAVLLTGCASKPSPLALNDSALNRSALYDPPTVHLIDGKIYQFKEGTLKGSDQMFHSHFAYLRALIIGADATK